MERGASSFVYDQRVVEVAMEVVSILPLLEGAKLVAGNNDIMYSYDKDSLQNA